MKNLEIAKIFNEMADILEFEDVEWKPRAYRKAANSIENLTKSVEELAEKNELEDIPGVGESISEKIKEYLKTGKIKAYENLKKDYNFNIHELMQIPNLGPKKSKKLHKELKINTVKDLKKAAKAHKIRELKGFGEKSEKSIIKGINLYKKRESRMLLRTAWVLSKKIIKELKKLGVNKITPTGSLRRMKETIGDIDILATSKHKEKVMNEFIKWNEIKDVIAQGLTKTSVILKGSNKQVDVRLVNDNNWGAAMIYFTGSKKHNIEIRKTAIKKGYKLNEYSLSKNDKIMASTTEKKVYNKLGLQFIPPELREDTGEIKASLKKELPNLIKEEDIKGDLHIHTKWSDGSNTIKEMVESAEEKGYEYVCISDHSKSQTQAKGLKEEELLKQIKEVKKIDKEFKNIKVLTGVEVDILKNGSLDLNNEVLEKLDIVIASVHSGFKSNKKEMTNRICKALQNKYVNVLGHPTGRKINERQGYEVDLEKVFKIAKKNKIAMEVNASPKRLDLKDTNVRRAVEKGVKLVINTDAHQEDNLNNMKFGVGTARRGWCSASNVINTLSLKELKLFLNKK